MIKEMLLLICILFLVVGCNNMRDYSKEEICFEDIANQLCEERSEEYYMLDYSSGHNIISWHSNLPLSFICINGNENVSHYIFTREQLEECVDK